MKRAYFVCLLLCLATSLWSQSNPVSLIDQTAGVVSPITASPAGPQAQARILDQYGKLPLSFEANQGQADARVKFLSSTGGYTLFLTGDEAVLALRGKKATKSSPQGLKPTSLARLSGSAEAMPFPKAIHGTNSGKHDAASDRTTGAVLRMKLRNANPAAKVTGVDELAGTSNYFIGNDPAKWRTRVPTYARVKYEGIYPGIDVVYYGNQRQLEYDFIVAPGADPHRIAFDIRGAKRIRRDARGDLVLKVSDVELRWHKPVVYQEKDGARQLVAARYAITDSGRVRFEVAKYDASRTLYIDPLIYSSYLGGSGWDQSYGIAVDSAGNAYVTGSTGSTDFPTTPGALQTTCAGNCNSSDAFVSKVNAAGSALVYSTYIGGADANGAQCIAVDSAGNAYVTGFTASTDFPTTPGAYQKVYGGGWDAFVIELNPEGSALVYSTYLGGSGQDQGNAIALDSAGSAYVTGFTQSTDFPVTPGAYQTTCSNYCADSDAFVAKINASGSALVYSTYLGGSALDSGNGVAVDGVGSAYIIGVTGSPDFPMTHDAFQTIIAGAEDAFVTKLNSAGSGLVYSTYLGGNNSDVGLGIALDSGRNAYVTGNTPSTNFPVTPGAFQTICKDGRTFTCSDAFVTKINPTGSGLVYSTYLGGRYYDAGRGIAIDSAGNAYVTGGTFSSDFPVTEWGCAATFGGAYSGYSSPFVTKLNTLGTALAGSTCLNNLNDNAGSGIALDSEGRAYVTGPTDSKYFPTIGAFQTAYGGGGDAFISKLQLVAPTTTTLVSSLNPSIYGQEVTFTVTVTSAPGAPPDGEIITFRKGTTVLGTRSLSGGSASFTTSTLAAGSNYIQAVYGGDANFAPSTSKAVIQVVNKATTTTTLTSSLNPSNYGQTVIFTATVTPQFSGTPKAPVTFYDGTTVLKKVGPSGGVATYKTSTLTSGAHTITATFDGGTNFLGSSASLKQVVNKATTTTTLASSLNPSNYGQAVTFTATVTPQFSGTPKAPVTFYDGTTVLKTIGPIGGVATYKTSTLTSGSHSITATFNGGTNFLGSSASLTQQVN